MYGMSMCRCAVVCPLHMPLHRSRCASRPVDVDANTVAARRDSNSRGETLDQHCPVPLLYRPSRARCVISSYHAHGLRSSRLSQGTPGSLWRQVTS